MEWKDVLTLAFSAGIVTTVLNQGAGWLKDVYTGRRDRREAGTYLALRVALLLERFARRASDRAAEIEEFEDSSGASGSPHRSLPRVPEFPEESESWRWMDPHLAARALGFHNNVKASQRAITEDLKLLPDDRKVSSVAFEQLVDRGLEASEVASLMRRKYAIAQSSSPFSYEDHLKRCAKRIKEDEAKARTRESPI